jgi:hypothetical protein
MTGKINMSEQKNISGKKAGEQKQKILTPIIDESFFKFENVGDIIAGLFTEQGYSDRWKRPLYTIGDKRILGKEQLDRLMKKVGIGDYIEVELIDTMATPNGQLMIFEVRK